MFIAMNRFQVKLGSEPAFEAIWAVRESYLGEMDGFIAFKLLKGPTAEDHSLYATHTVWTDRAAFDAWTLSHQFRRSHARAGNDGGPSIYLGHPRFEGFEVLRSEHKAEAAA